jgi:16S rRNA (cytosine967-C5)-methyltransferase
MQARKLAYSILNSVYKDKGFVNLLLNNALNESNLKPNDKGLVTNIVYGVLQNSMYLDYVIRHYCVDKKVDARMRTLLKCAFYQMYFMDKIPNYALVNETVEIAKSELGLQASKFANAVLNNAIRNPFTLKQSDFKDELSYLCMKYSHPEWLIRMIGKHYGMDKAMSYMKSNVTPPPLSLRVNTLKTSVEEMLKVPYFKKGNLSPVGLFYTGDEPIGNVKEFLEGLVTVQDESGQMVAEIMDPKENCSILDMCAAPGSKTFHLASKINNKGRIIACDLYEHRIQLLKNQIKRLGATSVIPVCIDSTKLLEKYKEDSFDYVLLDAPCSGYGVVRRKPDLLVNIDQKDLDGILSIQKELIDVAVKLVKQGGTLVYSTCTLNKKENENQVEYLLKKYPNFKVLEQRVIFPDEYDSDGFFICKLVRE